MSLEIAIQELTQAVLMNVRSTDLLLAQFAELNERPEVLHQETTQTTETPANVVGTKTKTKVEKKLTEDEIKETTEYKDLIKAMSTYNRVAMHREGGDKEKAREMTLAVITAYTEDGKAITIVRGHLEGTLDGDTLAELMLAYSTKTAELEASNETTAFEEQQAAEAEAAKAAEVAEASAEEDSDFDGDEDEVQYTDEDVKKALRTYAGVEGKPAAIAMLKKTTGSASVAGVDPSDYAKAIKALEV